MDTLELGLGPVGDRVVAGELCGAVALDEIGRVRRSVALVEQVEIGIGCDGVVFVDDGRIRLGSGSFDVAIPAYARCQRGDRVQVGLRPADLHVRDDATSDNIHGEVKLVERLGRNVELTVDVGGAELIVLASGREGHGEGAQVNLTVADSDVHVFAPGEGYQPRLTTTDRDSTLEAAQ